MIHIAKNKHIKKKKWWDEEIQNIYKEKVYWFKKYKEANHLDPFISTMLKKTRKEFRKKQRFKTKFHRRKQLKNLEKLFNLNKNKFWNEVKKIKRKEQYIEININELEETFQ